jgi:hypothetical protein
MGLHVRGELRRKLTLDHFGDGARSRKVLDRLILTGLLLSIHRCILDFFCRPKAPQDLIRFIRVEVMNGSQL